MSLFAATSVALAACSGGEPPAGTMSTGSSSGAAPSSAGPTGGTSTGSASTGGPTTTQPAEAYEPATPTSPAKNVPKPVMPPAAKQKSFEGQKAFIQYWIDTYNYMRESGDPEPFLAACDEKSKFCSGSVQILEELNNSQAWRIGCQISYKNIIKDVSPHDIDKALVSLTIMEKPCRYYDPSGESKKFEKQYDTQVSPSVASLRYDNLRWVLLEIAPE